MRYLIREIENCVFCPHFYLHNVIKEEGGTDNKNSGLFCRQKGRFIERSSEIIKKKLRDSPIPEWCPLPKKPK